MKSILLVIAMLIVTSVFPAKAEDGAVLALAFQQEVNRRLDPPQETQAIYAQLLEAALKNAGIPIATSQYILVADSNPNVQAIFLYWLDSTASSESDRWHFIGASPVSTGKPGKFDYFITPQGVFAHSLKNKDFRAEGTLNNFGIRGYGRKGMRVFDFGWVQATQGWSNGGEGQMRLLLHATDPDYLEPYLGNAKSKGCIRIPATLNTFIDHYGLLDADYEQALTNGEKMWVLRTDRSPTHWSGRYLAIVDSGSIERPAWSPKPAPIARQPTVRKTPGTVNTSR